MAKDDRDLLEVLKFELQFLEKEGYGRSPRTPWRPSLIFQDSPTCLNYDSLDDPRPCSECVLMQLAPPEYRTATIPCRHIPLNAHGETIDLLYRYGDQPELEDALRAWLREMIHKIDLQRNREPNSTAIVKWPDAALANVGGTVTPAKAER